MLKGWKTFIFNIILMSIVTARMWGVEVSGFQESDIQVGLNAIDAALTFVWGVGNLILRLITNTPAFKKSMSNQMGFATLPVILLVGILCVSAVTMLIGCSTTHTADSNAPTAIATQDNPSSDVNKTLALARIISRRAGDYVAKNNPVACHSVAATYQTIKSMEGDDFQQAFLVALEDFLTMRGVAESEQLRADAADILLLFGYDLSSTQINLQFIAGFEVASIKSVIEAFIEGMALP